MSYSNITKGLKNKISNFDNVQNLEFSFFSPQINYINNIFHFEKNRQHILSAKKNYTSIWVTGKKKVGKAELFRLKYLVINSYSENFAFRNSRLRRAMWSMEIPLGHSISQARVLVQLPKPSSSIFATIFLALRAASGLP